ncbi:MAG: hypothetical protein J6X79_04630 [Bacteroidales bacterium]|nr:hypothetical protein [Bacteroidales bacterium]
MKKSLLLVAMLSVLATSIAQEDNVFNIHYNWDKMLAYTYQPGYPYGFGLAGGSFMSFGFSDGETRYLETTTDYYQSTWSLRFGWVGYSIDEGVTGWGAVTFRPFVNMGMDFMKHYTQTASGMDSKTKTYFTFAPSLAVNVYMLNFFVGYEIVPRFKQLNGLNFGAGFSIPLKSSKTAEKSNIIHI